MFSSWSRFCGSCVSRVSALARSCFLGREKWRRRCHALNHQVDELRGELITRDAERLRGEAEVERLRKRVRELEVERERPQTCRVPLGDPPHGQQYGDGLISLCVNLARKIGLRPTERALEVVVQWLGVTATIPSYQSIRLWMQRIGLARMNQAQPENGGTWLVDITQQLGVDRVLAVARVRDQPATSSAGPLQRDDLEILALVPGRTWGRAEVTEAYRITEHVCGTPRAVVTDGAVELREPVACLGKSAKNRPLSRRDLKHFLANQMERLLGRDPRFTKFSGRLGGLRSKLPMTELGHFVPPAPKQKSRFMNLAATIHWATALLWHLRHFESRARQGIRAQRFQSRFGWLREFADNLADWQACHAIIGQALKFIGSAGIYRGAAREFARRALRLTIGSASRELVERTRWFLKNQEKGLRKHEHLPLSTEALESCFAAYKQLIRQHAKAGISTLLLVLPTLLRPTTPLEVTRCLEQVHVADVVSWGQINLPDRFQVRRAQMYGEARANAAVTPERATENSLAT